MKIVRPICADDCRVLLAWRNHPETRRWCFDDRVIDPLAHEAWFRDLLGDPQRVGLMLIDEGLPVAHIRFDPCHQPGQLTISIMTSPEHRGRGYGRDLLGQALHHEEVTRRAVLVRAETFENNAAARKLFEGAGFKLMGHGTRQGHAYLEWRLPISPLFVQYPFGLEGEGPLLAAVLDMLATFEITPRFVVRSEPYSRENVASGVLGASSPLSIHLQDQALATGARALFICDWPERIPPELLAHFKDGIFALRRAASQNEAFLELHPGLFECYGVTTATVGGMVLDHLAHLVFRRQSPADERPTARPRPVSPVPDAEGH
ncbi:MAG: hypothetical protein OZSIB_3941 [Candidatus Ozemobacter sibiricus]|uniref:N-acetyltransferase domain-containing protein n=1 Tax=Candidatus Ozemobacter sibiricus TaxID=2268124 RepID=A0A367ZPL8_9BACT|nr:MAG: hypothetical protein OZSIB_3941 [Candidatus Ozemobacter sibiricus]